MSFGWHALVNLNVLVVPRRKDAGAPTPVRELYCCGKWLEALEVEAEEIEKAGGVVHEDLLGERCKVDKVPQCHHMK